MAGQQPWDGGRPVAARGRYYVECPANASTTLSETEGRAGDDLDWIWIFPATVAPGAVTLNDGANPVWAWPAGIALNDTRPIFVPLNLRSREGAWQIVCGANVAAVAAGAFQ